MEAFNFNFKFDNVNLGKLYNDPTKGENINLSNAIEKGNYNSNLNGANAYGGTNSNQTETLDLSLGSDTQTSQNINVAPNNSATNPFGQDAIQNGAQPGNGIIQNGTNNSNNPNAMGNSIADQTEGAFSSNGNGKDAASRIENANAGKNGSFDMNKNFSNENTDTKNNMFNTNRDGNADINLKKDTEDKFDQNTFNTGGSRTNQNDSDSMNLFNNRTGNSFGNNDGEFGFDLNQNDAENATDKGGFKNGNGYITDTDRFSRTVRTEIDSSEYVGALKVFGLREADIMRVLSGSITIENLIDEIQNDKDNTRRGEMLAASYLQAYGLEFSSLKELDDAIKETKREISTLKNQKETIDNRELDTVLKVINDMRFGGNLDDVLSQPAAWEYQDKDGKTHITYVDPYLSNDYDSEAIYNTVTIGELYKDSNLLKELKSLLTEETYKPLFSKETKTVYKWKETVEQNSFFERLFQDYENTIDARTKNIENIDAKIQELQSQVSSYLYLYDTIAKEIAYTLNYIDAYINNADYKIYNTFDRAQLDKLEEFKKAHQDTSLPDYYDGLPIIDVTSKEEVTTLVACILNEDAVVDGKYITIGTVLYQISSKDDLVENFGVWKSLMTTEEKSIFNYILNKEGADSAYKYLQDISDELDYRWLADRTMKDQNYATEHPVLSSIASIVVTPIEGLSAACYSLNSYFNDEKIRRTTVYSSGDVWRGEVAQNIAEAHGEGLSFLYSTGMSMADSVSLIGVSALTGGAAVPALSATLMGSRSYVSSLNDALDRGLTDGSAIALAFSAAAVETLMESYSVGHLLNLETKLGASTSQLVSKIATIIPNETVASIATKSTYLVAGAISQGIAEGEEEFATEILNYIFDEIIAGDLSNHSLSIANYLSIGKTENEARSLANGEFVDQLGQAFLGGFVSGVCFGTFGGVRTAHNVSKNMAQDMLSQVEGNKAQKFAQGIEASRIQAELAENLEKISQKEQRTQLLNDLKNIFIKNADFKEVAIPSIEPLTLPKMGNAGTSMEMAHEIFKAKESFNPVILEEINEHSITQDAFDDFFLAVLNGTAQLPPSYESMTEFKQDFVRGLIESGKLDELANKYTFFMSKDPIMLKELVGTEKLIALYSNNFLNKNFQSEFIKNLSTLTTQEFNSIFDSSELTTLIGGLEFSDFKDVVQQFSNFSKSYFLTSEAFVNKIISLDKAEFYELMDGISTTKEHLDSTLRQEIGIDAYVKLLDSVEEKFYNREILLGDIAKKNAIDNILPFPNFPDKRIESKLRSLEDAGLEAESTLKQNLVANIDSKIALIDDMASFGAKVDENFAYYDITLELDGISKTITVSQSDGTVDFKWTILKNAEYAAWLAQGKIKIKDVSANIKKSNLVITEAMGLKQGINEIVLSVDGRETTLVISSKNGFLKDVNDMLETTLKDTKSVEVVKVTGKGDFDIQIEDSEALYKVSYQIGNVQQEVFMTTPKTIYYKNTDEHVLNINDFIQANNLSGVTNVVAEKIDLADTRNRIPKISEYKAFSEVMSNEQYGGNQSDIPRLLHKKLEGESLTGLEGAKAELLENRLIKYFPDITDVQKLSVSEHFAEGGCGWIASSNAFMTFIGSQENGAKIFSDTMGFDMLYEIDGIKSYNVEALAFDMYLSYISKEYHTVENIFKSHAEAGMGPATLNQMLVPYFKERGFGFDYRFTTNDAKTSMTKSQNSIFSALLNNKNSFNILIAKNFDLKITNASLMTEDAYDGALANATTNGLFKENIGAHAMLITDIKENLDLTVSSWGKQFEFNIESTVKEDSTANVMSFEFTMPNLEAAKRAKIENAKTDVSSDIYRQSEREKQTAKKTYTAMIEKLKSLQEANLSDAEIENTFSSHLGNMIMELYSDDYRVQNIEYLLRIESILDTMNPPANSATRTRMGIVKNIVAEAKQSLADILGSGLQEKLVYDPVNNKLSASVDENAAKIYTAVYEVDGNIVNIPAKAFFGKIYFDVKALSNINSVKDILNGNLRIKAITPDYEASKKIFNRNQLNFENGLNEVTVVVDGVRQTFIVLSDGAELNLNNPRLKGAKNFTVESIKPLGTYTLEVNDHRQAYKMTYTVNGIEHEKIVFPELDFYGNLYVMTDKIIEQYNIVGIENIHIEPTDLERYKNTPPPHQSFEAFERVYAEKFGGDQSDVDRLVGDFWKNNKLSAVDVQKAKLLDAMINHHFKDATPIQKVNLAEAYVSNGCAYMAIANNFITYMDSIKDGPQIFKERLGFDIKYTDGQSTSYNFEALAFDIFLHYYTKQNMSIESIIENSGGLRKEDYDTKVTPYFKEKGITCTVTSQTFDIKNEDLRKHLFASMMNSDGLQTIGASHFDLKDMSRKNKASILDRALQFAKKEDDSLKDIGGHAMVIVGFDEQLNPIVSSWGEKYTFLVDSLKENLTEGADLTTYEVRFKVEPTIPLGTRPDFNYANTQTHMSEIDLGKTDPGIEVFDLGKTDPGLEVFDLGKTDPGLEAMDEAMTDPGTLEIDTPEPSEIKRLNRELLKQIRLSQPVGDVRQLSDLEMIIKRIELKRLKQDFKVKNYLDGVDIQLDADTAQKVVQAEKLAEELSMQVGSLSVHETGLVEKYKHRERGNIELKNKILAAIAQYDNPFTKARALYIELNKSIYYDSTYFKASKEIKNALVEEDITFASLSEDRKVVCKGWAQLYRELLIEAGFNPEDVEVKGKGHYWVEIKYGDKILVADATDKLDGRIDLTAVKSGMQTNGFVILPKTMSGIRLHGLYAQDYFKNNIDNVFNRQLLATDNQIGFATQNGYLKDQLDKSKKLFGNSGLFKKIFKAPDTKSIIEQYFDRPIPGDMDGYEIYTYFKTVFENVLDEKEFHALKFNNHYKNMAVSDLSPISENVESIIDIEYNDKEGQTVHYIYSKTLGKRIITDAIEYQQFLRSLRL